MKLTLVIAKKYL